MNTTEHLVTILGEEGSEISQDCSKAVRFGLDDVNFLKPEGDATPTNRERIVNELNDLMAVVEMLVNRQILPHDWMSREKIEAKKIKVIKCMKYAKEKGVLDA